MSNIPNPGSAEAAGAGCSCSPLFNNKGLRVPEGGWKIRPACPVHAAVVPPEEWGEIALVPAKALKNGPLRRLGRWVRGIYHPSAPELGVMEPGPLLYRSEDDIDTRDESDR